LRSSCSFGRLRAHLHAGFAGVVHEAGVALAAVDLDQAEPARAEGLQAVGRAQLGHLDAGVDGGAHQRGALGHVTCVAVDLERDF
jgi:hypothetical protein